MEKTKVIEGLCGQHQTTVSVTEEDVVNAVKALDAAKKAMLESSVYALQEGEALLSKLNCLWTQSTMDSRPDFIRRSVSLAIEQVELWLESLHDRRVEVTAMLTKRKRQLEQSKSDCRGLTRLRELESILANKKESLINTHDLGSNAVNADSLLQDNLRLQDEAAGYSEECLQYIKQSTCQASPAPSSNMQSSVKAYNILEQSAEYQHLLEQRSGLLTQACSYFNSLKSVTYRYHKC